MMEIDVGIEMFSLVMGGELRLIERLPGVAPSTSILVRGGAGSGKTALGLHLAAGLARALGGDVAYACVEIVPAELRAIHDGVAVKESAVVDLTSAEPADNGGVRIFAANLDVVGVEKPDAVLPGEVERFVAEAVRASAARGVRVLVLDSLSQGYGLGLGAPRALADGLVKFAAERGLTVILLEETVSSEPSQWCFAVDTVLELSGADGLGPGARWMRVTKHRYAAATVGPHLLEIGHTGVELYPAVATYGPRDKDLEVGKAAKALYTAKGSQISVENASGLLVIDVGRMPKAKEVARGEFRIKWPVGRSGLHVLREVWRASASRHYSVCHVRDLGALRLRHDRDHVLDALAVLRGLLATMQIETTFIESEDQTATFAMILA